MGDLEQGFVEEAFETNWLSSVGPHVSAFGQEFAEYVGTEHAVALSSGTAALHLAIRLSGVGVDDEVVVSSLTFCASVNPILYERARPVFVDAERESWNLDPNLVEDFFRRRAAEGRLPKALVAVHLYGQCADLGALVELCERYEVVLIEDAAEALGASYWGGSEKRRNGETERRGEGLGREGVGEWESGREGVERRGEEETKSRRDEERESGQGKAESEHESKEDAFPVSPSPRFPVSPSPRFPVSPAKGRSPGIFGKAGIFSFNGNKIITTSGGGMLVTDDGELAAHVRKLATQAREDAPHYEHTEVGFNYRMSNVLAGIGRGQLRVLDDRVAARRLIFERYVEALGDLPGVEFQPEAPWGMHTRWLTCLTIDPEEAGVDREAVRLAMEAENIEARPVWKPMHLQPVFAGYESVGGEVAEGLFRNGLCLPSGSAMSEEEVERVIGVFRDVLTC